VALLERNSTIDSDLSPTTFLRMTRLQELEQQAGRLPDAERAVSVTRLLATLPPVLAEADGGIAEARLRDAELDTNPSAGLNDTQFRAAIAASRKR